MRYALVLADNKHPTRSEIYTFDESVLLEWLAREEAFDTGQQRKTIAVPMASAGFMKKIIIPAAGYQRVKANALARLRPLNAPHQDPHPRLRQIKVTDLDAQTQQLIDLKGHQHVIVTTTI